MASQGPEVVQITPSPESLIIKHTKNHGSYNCTEDQCFFSTSSPSLLGLHKAQAHDIRTGAKKGKVHQYFCPGPGCHYNPQSGRFFKNLDMLRTHYMKVHSEKSFKCSKCEKAFGLERDCLYHEKECGQTYTCPDCGKSYNNRSALKWHCISKDHKKPPELDPRPKAPKSKPVSNQPKPDKGHPVPILPKLSSLDMVALPPPATPVTRNANSVILSSGSPVKILLHNGSPQVVNFGDCNPPSTFTVCSSQKPLCDNVTQTGKLLSSVSSQTTVKRHAPTQTRLSILEKAMKSSKIPVMKTSKATQKSYTKSGPRKRKTTDNVEMSLKKHKSKSRMTVATLTDPLLTPLVFRNNFSQNTGSQTMFTIFENQQKDMSVGAVQIQDKSSMSTQTLIQTPDSNILSLNHLQETHSNPHDLICLSNSADQFSCAFNDHNMLTDSITQTLCPFTEVSRTPLSNCQTQTSLKQSSSSNTQTQQIPALDSSTQTQHLNPHSDDTSDFLDELLTENERNDVDTQTFGSFFSDMMTQTLEDLVCEDNTLETVNQSLGVDNIVGVNNTMTQTFEETVDNITQTVDSNITDCMTQTNIGNDIMTQTFDNLGVDMMTQTFHITNNFGTQHYMSQNYAYGFQTETAAVNSADFAAQTTFENNAITQTATSFNGILSTVTNDDFTQIVDFDCERTINNVLNNGNEVLEMASQESQTLPFDDSSTQGSNTLSMNTMTQTVYPFDDVSNDTLSLSANNPLTDSMTQTLSMPDEDLMLDTLLSDMATQTFEDEDFFFDDLLQSPEDFSSNFVSQNSPVFTDTACQTPIPLSTEVKTTAIKSSDQSIGVQTAVLPATTVNCNNVDNSNDITGHNDNLWHTGTQTAGDIWLDVSAQTVNENSWGMATHTGNNLSLDMASQTAGYDVWKSGTQTRVENAGTIGVQTMEDNFWEMGTQTGNDTSWEMGTQTGGDALWEMGTQTGGDALWEMGTQTGGDALWEMGTQTGGDALWEMGTQTGGDALWEMGTQTGGDALWEMGTQTGGDALWEMGTQTGGDALWEMGTQTVVDDLWEMGTQTGGDDLWEMGTQTGGDDLWEMGTQTQTMDSLLTDTMTQTGDDLLDFLTANQGFDQVTTVTASVNTSFSQSVSCHENTQTQASSPMFFSELDLFHDAS